MKKKIALAIVLAIVIVGGAFAQEAASTGPANWVYGQVGLINIGVGYERVLTPSFSIGAEAYWNNFFFFWNSNVAEVYGKYYPFQGKFYAKLGLGAGTISGTEDDLGAYTATGFIIDPGIGWKIDVGNPGGFYIEPKISIPIVIGKREFDAWGNAPDKDGIKVGANFAVAFAMGYAF